MAQYPLSAKSSKNQSHKNTELTSSLIERSACQSQTPELLNQAQYRHILKGECVFIQLYYQGKVIPTAYNEWISFMGGTLYKRLNPKVTIFLTNTDSNDLTTILQRVRKVCSACKVVSILWFEQCFQQKKRVPFDGFQLDLEKDKVHQYKLEEAGKEDLGMDKFLKDLSEDIELDFKDFLRKEGSHPFQILPKNHCALPQNVLSGKQIDLGPHPTKKPKNKPENKPEKQRKTIKGSSLIPVRIDTLTSPRESKSMGSQFLKKQGQMISKTQQKKTKKSEEQLEINEVQLVGQKQGRLSLDRLMSKYLGNEDLDLNQINEENEITNHLQAEAQEKQIINSIHEIQKKNQKEEISKHNNNEQNGKKTYKTCISIQSKKSSMTTQRMTLSAIGSRYKDVDRQINISPLNTIKLKTQIEELKNDLAKDYPNTIFVVSRSKSIQERIQKANQLACTENTIKFRFISFTLYWRYMDVNPELHEIYFLIEPTKIIDRPLYFALTKIKPKTRLVAVKLIDIIKSYNLHYKQSIGTPKKMERHYQKYISQITMLVNKKPIEGKKVAILSSDLPSQLHKRIIDGLGGKFIPNEQYLLGQEPDILVTNRLGLKQKNRQTYQELKLWKNVFNLEGVVDQ